MMFDWSLWNSSTPVTFSRSPPIQLFRPTGCLGVGLLGLTSRSLGVEDTYPRSRRWSHGLLPPSGIGARFGDVLIWILVGKIVQDKSPNVAGVETLMRVIVIVVVSYPWAISLCVTVIAVFPVSVAAEKWIALEVRSTEFSYFFGFT